MLATRLRTSATAAGLLAVPFTAVPPAAAAGAATGGAGSAYGVYARGLLNMPARPSVTSAAGPARIALALPANPLLNGALFTVEAHPRHASAVASNLAVTVPELKKVHRPTGLLAAGAISARCDDGVGSARLADVTIAGHRLPIGGPPNTDFVIPMEGVGLRATPNKQVQNADGTLSVVGLELDVSIGRSLQTIDIASATCGRADGRPAPSPTVPGVNSAPAGLNAEAAPRRLEEAPRPVAVPYDLAVTG